VIAPVRRIPLFPRAVASKQNPIKRPYHSPVVRASALSGPITELIEPGRSRTRRMFVENSALMTKSTSRANRAHTGTVGTVRAASAIGTGNKKDCAEIGQTAIKNARRGRPKDAGPCPTAFRLEYSQANPRSVDDA